MTRASTILLYIIFIVGTAFLMELSLEPSMSQLSMTSQTAIWLRSRKFLFSFVDAGSGSFRTQASKGDAPQPCPICFLIARTWFTKDSFSALR